MKQIELTEKEVEHLLHLLSDRLIPTWCLKDNVNNGICKHYSSIKGKLTPSVLEINVSDEVQAEGGLV